MNEIIDLVVKRDELLLKLTISKKSKEEVEKKLQEIGIELKGENSTEEKFKLVDEALLRSQRNSFMEIESYQNELNGQQDLIRKFFGVVELIKNAEASATQVSRDAEKCYAKFKHQIKISPWVTEKNELLNALKDRKNCLQLALLKIDELVKCASGLQETLNGHSRYPLKEFCLVLANYKFKSKQIRRSLFKEMDINRERKEQLAQNLSQQGYSQDQSMEADAILSLKTKNNSSPSPNVQVSSLDTPLVEKQMEVILHETMDTNQEKEEQLAQNLCQQDSSQDQSMEAESIQSMEALTLEANKNISTPPTVVPVSTLTVPSTEKQIRKASPPNSTSSTMFNFDQSFGFAGAFGEESQSVDVASGNPFPFSFNNSQSHQQGFLDFSLCLQGGEFGGQNLFSLFNGGDKQQGTGLIEGFGDDEGDANGTGFGGFFDFGKSEKNQTQSQQNSFNFNFD